MCTCYVYVVFYLVGSDSNKYADNDNDYGDDYGDDAADNDQNHDNHDYDDNNEDMTVQIKTSAVMFNMHGN